MPKKETAKTPRSSGKHKASFFKDNPQAKEAYNRLRWVSSKNPAIPTDTPTKCVTSRDRRDSRDSQRASPIYDIEVFLGGYIAVPLALITVIAAWILAAWLSELWDRFPHLAVTSPEHRCGKTRLLQLLEQLCPNTYSTSNISPTAIYRLIATEQITIMIDEAQSLERRGSESSEVVREIFNSAIDQDAKVFRCVGSNHDVKPFPIYCPKVLTLIGKLDGVLSDRCLPNEMRRKTADNDVRPYRSRLV
jgi:putative DNA primase/helicase